MTSFKVINFPKFQGVQDMLSGGGGGGRGGGVKRFFQGDGVQFLSDRTYDSTPAHALDPRNFQDF